MIPILPPLKADSEVTLATIEGQWNDDGARKRLPALAKAIEVPPGINDIHSIPDPWARVILFDRALYDAQHSLHKQVLGEWRGMLALLGLRERMGILHLTAKLVDLPERGDNRLFTSILGRILPSEGKMLREDETWRKFYILSSSASGKSKPFGMTSPTTLVATGAWYPNVFTQQEVPWFGRDKVSGKYILGDPGGVLSKAESKALAEWVLNIRRGLGQTTTQRGGWMLTLLEKYATDLDPAATLLDEDKILARGRGLRIQSTLASILDLPHKPETKTLSDLQIETDRPKAGTYVLIDSKIGSQLGRDPKEIVVHRDITLASVSTRLPDFSRVNTGKLGDGATDLNWCRQDFFFASHLVYDLNSQAGSSSGKVTDPFPGCRPVRMEGQPDTRRILIPLREEVMKLFTADYLEDNFSVEWKSDGTAICRLLIKVKSISNPEETGEERVTGTHTVTLEQEYPRDNCVRIPTTLPVGIWPNFKFKDDPERWRRYYMYQSWRGSTNMSDFVVKPPTSLQVEDRPVTQGTDFFYVYKMPEFPEYLTCEMASRDTADGYQAKPIGLMLLRVPEAPRTAGGKRGALGIDFGTTGTSIYWSWVNDPQPQQMRFMDRFLRVTDVDVKDLKRQTREMFLPAQELSTGKILSVYQVFTEPTEREMLDGHVLFASDDEQDAFIPGRYNDVRSNLKWGDDHQTAAATSFLTQLCLESLAEMVVQGAGSVDIRYSYPTAFSVEDTARFIGIWGSVIERLQDATSVSLDNNGDQVENREAVAATRFFSNLNSAQGFSISRGGLTIDIGGGTTDIALWSRNANNQPSLMAHLSVLFAGRDIFQQPLQRRASVLADIDPSIKWKIDDMEAHRRDDMAQNADACNAQLDSIIAAGGDRMLKLLPQRKEKVEDFLSIISTGLCGLAFYSGLLAGRLAKAGGYAPTDLLSVFVGGNGSRLLLWCAINYFKPGMRIYDNFAGCVLAGCQMGNPDLKPKVQIVLSPKPKEEVAFGLVAHGLGSSTHALKIDDDFTSPLAGESFKILNTGDGAWSDTPSAQDFRNDAIAVDPGLPLFRAFLKAADIQVDDPTLTRIADLVNDKLTQISTRAQTLQGKDADQRTIDPIRKEPIFIMALKILVKMQIDQWVSRV